MHETLVMTIGDKRFDEVGSLLSGKRVLVAFSGGVDSTVLAHLAKANAEETVLLTVDGTTFPKSELQAAADVAKEVGIPIEVIQVDDLSNQDFARNPIDRCYHCKKELAAAWVEKARQLGMDVVVEGTNASDMKEHRPGALALEEIGVLSPFREYGITKSDIRAYAKEVGLSVADRPSMACLASRFPYGTEITEARVRSIEEVESGVKALFGVSCVRARFHGDVVRIEVGRDERNMLFDVTKLDQLHAFAKSAGFKYVAFDVLGYRTGAMDEVLDQPAEQVE